MTSSGQEPDFIVIGAAKAGTTSLAEYFSALPSVFMSTPKEIEFFARDDHYAKGIDWYRSFFAAAEEGQLKAEASTIYSLSPLFPHTAERVAAHLPDVKLIYILREPVSRAYSYYAQLQKNYRRWSRDPAIHRSFEDFIHAPADRAPRDRALAAFDAHLPDEPGLILDGSDYPSQIEAWLRHFPRDQILFLFFEELHSDPQAVLARIHAFLGLPEPAPDASLPHVNESRGDFARLKQDRMAKEMAETMPVLRRLSRLLPEGFRRSLRGLLLRGLSSREAEDPGKPRPMRPETRARLNERFLKDRPRIRNLTGLDPDAWWDRPA